MGYTLIRAQADVESHTRSHQNWGQDSEISDQRNRRVYTLRAIIYRLYCDNSRDVRQLGGPVVQQLLQHGTAAAAAIIHYSNRDGGTHVRGGGGGRAGGGI